jgi:hypothetical protein
MHCGYELTYTATKEALYWNYVLGTSPLNNPPAGVIERGTKLYLQRPADRPTLGTHQSAYVDGIGQIIMRVEDLKNSDPDC